MKVTVTPDMVGRANALMPELPYETVKAMLEASLSSLPLPVTFEIRNQVIASSMPELVGGFLRHLRLHQIALVFHDGLLEGNKTTGTAAQSLMNGAKSYSELIGDEGVACLFEEARKNLWDGSGGLQAAKLV